MKKKEVIKVSKRTGSGHFEMEVIDGQLRLYIFSEEKLEKAKKNGYRGTLILNASYIIDEGVLYLGGEVVSGYELASGVYYEYDYDEQELIDKMLELYYISDESVYTREEKKWFGPNRNITKRYIERGYYLSKKGFQREYKTSSFRVIE